MREQRNTKVHNSIKANGKQESERTRKRIFKVQRKRPRARGGRETEKNVIQEI